MDALDHAAARQERAEQGQHVGRDDEHHREDPQPAPLDDELDLGLVDRELPFDDVPRPPPVELVDLVSGLDASPRRR